MSVRPYSSRALMRLETASLTGSSLLVFAGLLVSSSAVSPAGKTTVTVCVLAFNCFVFLLFGWTLLWEVERVVLTICGIRTGADGKARRA